MEVEAEDKTSLPPELVQYIHALSEPISIYTRYMDALLIKRSDHPAFFRDLKTFRCQPQIMTLLTTNASSSNSNSNQEPPSSPSSDSPSFNTKEMYLNVTNSFLASRYAHPWCRTSQLKSGWFKAEWNNLKKQDEARQREEQRLHKLLVPIWCGFRVRMMPSPEVLEKFILTEKEKEKEKEREKERKKLLLAKSKSAEENEEKEKEGGARMNQSSQQQRRQRQQPPRQTNAEAYCMELSDYSDNDDDDDYHAGHGHAGAGAGGNDDSSASAAGKLFVGVAATSFLANNRRARKYLMKKLNKKK